MRTVAERVERATAMIDFIASGGRRRHSLAEVDAIGAFESTDMRRRVHQMTTADPTLGRQLLVIALQTVTGRVYHAQMAYSRVRNVKSEARFWLEMNRWLAPSAQLPETEVFALVEAAMVEGLRLAASEKAEVTNGLMLRFQERRVNEVMAGADVTTTDEAPSREPARE